MPAIALTAQTVKNWKPDPTKRVEVPDEVVTGLYLVITPTGAKSWALRYRFAERPKKYTLGQFPAVPLAEARDLARDALVRIARGSDPAAERAAKVAENQAARDAVVRQVRDRFETVADEFFTRYLAPKNRSADESKRIIDTVLVPAWGARPVTEIVKRDVIELLDSIMDRGTPYMANRVLALTRKMFNWLADERGVIESSPVTGVKAPGKEESRDRVLDDAELVLVMAAADLMGWPFGPLVKVLALTGQRRDEVAGMRWQDVDLSRSVWTIPAHVAKNGRIHDVPLAPSVVEIIKALPRIGDLYMFSTTRTTPVSGFSRAKIKLDSIVAESRGGEPVPEWRLHDLRRTTASGMAQLGIAPHVVEKVLNHSSGTIKGVAAVYNRHEYLEERRRALEAWANKVESLTKSLACNVVPFRKAI